MKKFYVRRENPVKFVFPPFPFPHCCSILGAVKKNISYEVIYSDDAIVAVSKKAGLLVAADRYDQTAPRLDLELEKEFGRLFALHRIDKDTSGVVLYARTKESHRSLSLQFQNRQVEKIYHALVNGRPLWKSHHEEARLLPDGDPMHRTVVSKRQGKPSITNFRQAVRPTPGLRHALSPAAPIRFEPTCGPTS